MVVADKLCISNSGAAQALTTSMADSTDAQTIDCPEGGLAYIGYTASGTAATYIGFSLHYSRDGGTTWYRVAPVNSVSSGAVSQSSAGVWQGNGANGNWSVGPIEVPAACKLKVQALRSGGGADTAALAYLTVYGE